MVIDRLSKFTGDRHELLTPAQYTQLTGRAGRRGIDERGHALVPWSPFTRFDEVSALAASRAFRLRSAFRPTYNMAANLLRHRDAEGARALLARSFAQYQADVGVARLEQRLARERVRVVELREELESAGIDEDDDLPGLGNDATAIADAVSRLRPGDIVVDEDGELLAVLGVSWRKGGRARLRLVTQAAREQRWELADLVNAPVTVGHIDLPQPMAPERIDYREEVAERIRRSRARSTGRRRRRTARRTDDPRSRLRRAEQEVTALEHKARRDSASIARRFDAICAVLRERGHLDGWEVTTTGEILARVYHESDLLVTDSLVGFQIVDRIKE